MDLSDITIVANRKRVIVDAEKLREKMSRESSKIIKLRVAQDTAYWDLKERLSGVQGEHERLQQNMLDVQMQHEALSAQYQDELRMRPETLNKLAATREICDVLEEYAGRVRASLRRATTDRDALTQAYASAARQVQAATTTAHIQAAARAEKLRLSEERGAQLAECASDARRHAEVAVAAAREQLQAAAERAEHLQARADGLQDRAASLHAELQQRERIITELRQENERRAAESAAEMKRAEYAHVELQKELEERGVALGVVRDALANAEERVVRSAEEASRRGDAIQTLEKVVVDLGQKLETASVANEVLQKQIQEKDREASQSQARMEATQSEVDAMRAELQVEREARAREATVAGEAGLAAERALAERAETVARLMRDVAEEAEARARCNTALNNAEEQARALGDKLKIKEEELAVQVKIAFDIRGEKERLQDIIRKMQGTIDNIQKELTREPPAAAAHAAAAASAARREPPEHDDNALPAPSKPLRQGACIRPQSTERGVFLTPRPRCTNADDLLFHFLSDSSMDADTLDPREVNARFEALSRGTAPPATSLNALKRRHAEHPKDAKEADVSLSQVKTELAARSRTFFRNKRFDSKPKKPK